MAKAVILIMMCCCFLLVLGGGAGAYYFMGMQESTDDSTDDSTDESTESTDDSTDESTESTDDSTDESTESTDDSTDESTESTESTDPIPDPTNGGETTEPDSAPVDCSEAKNTGFNDYNTGKNYYLDRHKLSCDAGAINKFHLVLNQNEDPVDKMRYNYKCCSNITEAGATVEAKETPVNDDGDGNIMYLDRHHVDCGDKLVSHVKLHRPNGEQIQYQYSCLPAAGDLTCRDVTTDNNDIGEGHVIFLDRHNVQCADDEALSSFKLHNTGSGMQYQYKCCKLAE